MHMRMLVAALCLLIGAACSSDDASDPDAADLPDVFVFSSNSQCRAPLRKGAAAGEPCVLPDDCAEVCCTCDDVNPDRLFSAQACVAGECASMAVACAHAEQMTKICTP